MFYSTICLTVGVQDVFGLLDLSNLFNKVDKSVKFGPKHVENTSNKDYPQKFSYQLKTTNKQAMEELILPIFFSGEVPTSICRFICPSVILLFLPSKNKIVFTKPLPR